MRTVKRFLNFIGVIAFGFLLLIYVVIWAEVVPEFLRGSGIVYLAFLSLYFVGFWTYVRETQKWEFEYDIAKFQRGRTRSRFAKALIWLPSLIAAFVLFFFPVASHLPYPRSHFLTHYRVPIPWTVTVYDFQEVAPECSLVEAHVRSSGMGRFGASLFWDRSTITSSLTFGNFRSDPDVWSWERRGATGLSKKEIVAGDIAVSCHQYTIGGQRWYVDCQTPPDTGRYNFYARFNGSEADLSLFYSIVGGIRRTT